MRITREYAGYYVAQYEGREYVIENIPSMGWALSTFHGRPDDIYATKREAVAAIPQLHAFIEAEDHDS